MALRKLKFPIGICALSLLIPALGQAANNALIINGLSTTSETGTTNSITTNLSADIVAAGGAVTVSDTIPASISGYSQVWDIRFSNSSPLAAGDITKYLTYLQAGGTLFVMGENSGFSTRNNSVISLVSSAGGGSLTFTTPGSSQTVVAPFTSPNPVSSMVYNAPGGVIGLPSPGTGSFMTVDSVSHNGSGIWWNGGALSAAPSGTLAIVFDVNFMQTDADTNSQNFLKNLVGVFRTVSNGGTPAATASAAPAMSDFCLVLLGLMLMAMAVRVLRTAPAVR